MIHSNGNLEMIAGGVMKDSWRIEAVARIKYLESQLSNAEKVIERAKEMMEKMFDMTELPEPKEQIGKLAQAIEDYITAKEILEAK